MFGALTDGTNQIYYMPIIFEYSATANTWEVVRNADTGVPGDANADGIFDAKDIVRAEYEEQMGRDSERFVSQGALYKDAFGKWNLNVDKLRETALSIEDGIPVYFDDEAMMLAAYEGPKAKGAIDINKTPEENMVSVAAALGKDPSELTIVMLERERHQHIVQAARKLGARCKFISDGDVSPVIATGFGAEGIDMMMGTGGAPEGVIAAAAIKCMGGDMQGRLKPENEAEVQRVHDMGIADVDKVLTLDDLVSTDDVCFIATGVTNGDMLRGVRFTENHAITHTVVMRGTTGTVRFIEAYHDYDKKPSYVKVK